jgi:hypothetical protein
MPVEAIIERVLAPLAQQAPVLLLVADGLSYSIFRELCEDLEALGWDEQVAGPTPTLAVGIAALPTITEVSRTSLLSGRLVSAQRRRRRPRSRRIRRSWRRRAPGRRRWSSTRGISPTPRACHRRFAMPSPRRSSRWWPWSTTPSTTI